MKSRCSTGQCTTTQHDSEWRQQSWLRIMWAIRSHHSEESGPAPFPWFLQLLFRTPQRLPTPTPGSRSTAHRGFAPLPWRSNTYRVDELIQKDDLSFTRLDLRDTVQQHCDHCHPSLTIFTNASKPRSVPVSSLSPFISTQIGLPIQRSINSAGIRWLGLPPYCTCGGRKLPASRNRLQLAKLISKGIACARTSEHSH